MTRAKALTFLTILILSVGTIQSTVNAQGNYDSRYDEQYGDYSATYQDFYDGLAPYGQWINDPMYGYVWMPNVETDFRPYYTNGYWAMTQYGNTWVSNYDWGWAPFHYGRWTFDNYYGWLWIPDTQWAPAWVSWRSNNDYYGWAPLGPGLDINISISAIPVDWWLFVRPTYFYEPRFHRYCNNDWRFTRGIYRQTNYINYTYNDRRSVYFTGPRADDYSRRTGRKSSMFSINNNNRRGATVVRGNKINIYRPSIRNIENNAPSKIVQTERRVSSRPQTFVGNKAQPEGRKRVLMQSPVENTRSANPGNRGNITNPNQRNTQYDRINNRPAEPNREISNVRELEIQKQREAKMQMEQNRNRMMQERRDEEFKRQNNEQQRIQQENNRQQLLQQRDNQMMQQRNEEQNRQRYQAEESNRQRMQQIRDAQNERQRNQQPVREQINRPAQQAQPVQQIERTQQREQMRESQPMRREERGNQTAPANNDRQAERFRGR